MIVSSEDYNYDPTLTPVKAPFYALWHSFTKCIFVEEHDDIVPYKEKNDMAIRQPAGVALVEELED
ncbi:hypothetical protein D9756_009316 [Leucocoprinus leucothites]|uniref:Uncharacterized protein n=1 Tax=Leucocoprinus leucothites TaxID=201217 RepID=A0A8H5CW96_9AGAR|nr:hypothetical protein D9756_009316 [Leucoagaricus leucothites]